MSLEGSVGFVSACAGGGLEDSVSAPSQIVNCFGSVVTKLVNSNDAVSGHRFLELLEVELTSFISVSIMGIDQRFCPLVLSEWYINYFVVRKTRDNTINSLKIRILNILTYIPFKQILKRRMKVVSEDFKLVSEVYW